MDMLSLKNGELDKFVINKSGKTISVDSEGNWEYVYSEFIAKKNKKWELNQNLDIISMEQRKAVDRDVEQGKKLAMTIISHRS